MWPTLSHIAPSFRSASGRIQCSCTKLSVSLGQPRAPRRHKRQTSPLLATCLNPSSHPRALWLASCALLCPQLGWRHHHIRFASAVVVLILVARAIASSLQASKIAALCPPRRAPQPHTTSPSRRAAAVSIPPHRQFLLPLHA